MRCRTCGANLPAGAANCPNCGTAVPRPDETVVDTSSQEPPIPPTVYGGPVPPVPNYNSNVQNSYDRPPMPSSPSYNNQANQYPPSPYDPSGPNQYQPGLNNQANQYQPGGLNQNQPPPYQYPNQYTPGGMPPAYPPPGPGYMPPPQAPRRKTRWGLIIGIIAGVLILACIGTSLLIAGAVSSGSKAVSKQATAAASTASTPASTDTTPAANTTPAADATPAGTDTTPAATSNGASPSGLSIDPTAASIVTDAKTGKGFNSVDATPKDPTTNFKTGEQIYIVFKLNNDKVDYTTQKIYVTAKLYLNNTMVSKSDPLFIDKARVGGYFAGSSDGAGQGATELYLCHTANCSDAKLAQVVNFTVA